MNAIIDALHKRIFNLEIILQANNQISDRSHSIINDNLLSRRTNIMVTQEKPSQESVRNSIDTLSHQPRRSSLMSNQQSLNLQNDNNDKMMMQSK